MVTDKKESSASRVALLDAASLDSNVHQILKDKLISAAQYLPASVLANWESEIDALLQFAIWKISLTQFQATCGQQLLNISYGRSFTRKKSNLYALLTIGSRYVKAKSPHLTSYFGDSRAVHWVGRLVDWAETGVCVASLLNLLIFFQHGVYPTLIERLLRLRPVCTSGSRIIGYSSMTRELLWHGFIELLVFILPLVNYHYLKRKARHLFMQWKPPEKMRNTPVVFTAATRCAVCLEPPVIPHQMGCAHSFCYYCLMTNRLADIKFECPLCGYSNEKSEAVKRVEESVSDS